MQILASRARLKLAELAADAGLDATRRWLVEVLRPQVLGVALAWLAALVHHVVSGRRNSAPLDPAQSARSLPAPVS